MYLPLKNLLSYFGLVDARMSASDIDLPVIIRILLQKVMSTECLRLLRLLRPQKNKLSQHSRGLRKESAHKTQVRSNRRTGAGETS